MAGFFLTEATPERPVSRLQGTVRMIAIILLVTALFYAFARFLDPDLLW